MSYIYLPSSPVQWSWLSMQGADAKDFLHRLTTVNVRSLSAGLGANGFFLTAQGKVRAYFTLWNYGANEYAFEYDAGSDGQWKKELLATIDQYTFAEKFVLTDVTTLASRWIFPDPEDDAAWAHLGRPKAGETLAIDEEIRVCHHGDRDFGRPWITVWGRSARVGQWIDVQFPLLQSVTFDDLEKWRISAVRPRTDMELTAQSNPLEIGLVDAISQNKGCYPGQEVVERIISQGSPPRRLARIEGTGSESTLPAPGDKLFNLAEPPAEIGEVTSITPLDGERFAALGLIRKIHAKEGLEVKIGQNIRASITRIAPFAEEAS